MNNIRCFVIILILSLSFASQAVAEIEDLPDLRSGTSSIDRAIYSFEDSVVSVAQKISQVAGKGADLIVFGSQQVANVVFKPVVQNIDPRGWFRKPLTRKE